MELTDLDLDGTRCLAEIGIAGLVFCMGICMGIVWSLGFLVVLTVQRVSSVYVLFFDAGFCTFFYTLAK